MEFNNKLYELRKQKGLSQEELANRLNVSRQTVSKWEKGLSVPTVGAVYHYRLDATENTTPIRNIENDRYQNTDIYDLQGRRITGKPQKGLYIQNGKLISVK